MKNPEIHAFSIRQIKLWLKRRKDKPFPPTVESLRHRIDMLAQAYRNNPEKFKKNQQFDVGLKIENA